MTNELFPASELKFLNPEKKEKIQQTNFILFVETIL